MNNKARNYKRLDLYSGPATPETKERLRQKLNEVIGAERKEDFLRSWGRVG